MNSLSTSFVEISYSLLSHMCHDNDNNFYIKLKLRRVFSKLKHNLKYLQMKLKEIIFLQF